MNIFNSCQDSIWLKLCDASFTRKTTTSSGMPVAEAKCVGGYHSRDCDVCKNHKQDAVEPPSCCQERIFFLALFAASPDVRLRLTNKWTLTRNSVHKTKVKGSRPDTSSNSRRNAKVYWFSANKFNNSNNLHHPYALHGERTVQRALNSRVWASSNK